MVAEIYYQSVSIKLEQDHEKKFTGK